MNSPSKMCSALALTLSLSVFASVAAAEDTLRVIVFPGAQNLPLIVGLERGIFAKQGIRIALSNTPNSQELRNGLAEGKFDIAHAVVDNAVAMVEGAKRDAVIVAGEYSGFNDFMVRPEITGFDQLRGKVLAVDAPNTAYALVAKKILKTQGLIEGRDYTVKAVGGTLQRAQAMIENPDLGASMLNAPFSIEARRKGLKSLGRQRDLFGPYQAGGVIVMRNWGQLNSGLLERYLAAYIESTRFVMNPANRNIAVAALRERFALDAGIAEQTVDHLFSPDAGLSVDMQFDMRGFEAALGLRAEMEGEWNGTAPPPSRYLDLGYHARALELLK